VAYRLTDTEPAEIDRLTFTLFAEDGTAFAFADGRPALPTGELLPGEDWLLDATERIPLTTAGFFRQRVQPVAADGGHLYAFLDGAPYRGRRPHVPVELERLPAEALSTRLATAGETELGRFVTDAAHAFRTQTEESFHAGNLRLIEAAYLRGETAEAGSGSGSTPEQWRALREPIVDGIDADGTFLDLGCANGHLMDSVRRWAAERALSVEPYGVDIGAGLVELARRRLPQWADRIHVGNALTWTPADGRRFDYVHLLLDFVLPARRTELLRHALDLLVARRLLVSHYVRGVPPTARDLVTELGFEVAGGSGDTVWIDQ
jgi:hypothetical protein